MSEPDHTIIIDITVGEYVDGDEVNKVVWRQKGDQDLMQLMPRLITAVVSPTDG